MKEKEMLRRLVRRMAVLFNTCANGHKSTIMLPNGRQKCLDCQMEW